MLSLQLSQLRLKSRQRMTVNEGHKDRNEGKSRYLCDVIEHIFRLQRALASECLIFGIAIYDIEIHLI